MKAITYRLFAYALAAMLGVSFYFTVFKLFTFNPVIGLAIISSIVFIAVVLIREKDFVQETIER